MAPERLVLCGGAASAGTAPRNALRLAIYGPEPNVHFRLEELRRDLWREIPPVLRDLLDLAAYVYTADQAVPRAGGGRLDGDEVGEGWRRTFRFRVPVRELGRWRSDPVLTELISVLSFASEDTYEFEFVSLERDTPIGNFIDFSGTPYDGQVEEVMMFSGGLDSLAGAITASVVEGRRVLLVNHRSNEKLAPRHENLLRELTDRATGCPPLHFPVRLNKDKEHGREHTQRSRSFLFAAFGALFADMIGLSGVQFYENGVVSLNLPPSAQVVGARASRTTHPRVLDGFRRLFTALLGRDFTVKNPFLWDTKTDVVKRIAAAGYGHLIGLSTSCGHAWACTARQTHCGVCSQCIDRRFAVLAARQAAHDPATAYAVDLLTGPRLPGEPRTMLAAYLDLANRMEQMGESDFLTQFGEVPRALPYLDLPASAGVARVFDLYRRHAREVTGVIDGAIASHARDIRRGDLPRNCLLRLVTDEAGTEPEEPVLARPQGNYFIRRGEFWAIRYGGGREHVYPRDRGFDHLRILLSHPGTNLSAAELEARTTRLRASPPRAASTADALEGGVGVSLPTGDDMLDDDAIEALEARLEQIEQLRSTLTERGSPDDVDDLDELEAERDRIVQELERSRGLGGRTRKLGNPCERVRKRVGNAIRRAVDIIRDADEPLGAHLSKPALTVGNTLVYVPPAGVCWTVDE